MSATYAIKYIALAAAAGATAQLIETEGKSQSALLKEVKDAGATLSASKLGKLLKGEEKEIDGIKGLKIKPHGHDASQGHAAAAAAKAASGQTDETPAATPAPATPVAAAAATVAKAPRERQPSLLDRVRAANANPALAAAALAQSNLTDEQKALVKEVEGAEATATSPAKVSFKGTDWSKVLPQEPVAVKKDSVVHRLLKMLCTAGGVTKEQMMQEFGWSAGGFAGIIHWEPKAKGYLLITEKREGKVYYSLGYNGRPGVLAQPEEILFKEPKAPAAPKAPKEPKAPTEAKTKPQKADAAKATEPGAMTGVGVTTRRRVPKPAPAQAAAA